VAAFALISDIHSNLAALESVFARIDTLGIPETDCLGDVVGYGAEPEACIELVQQRCKWTLMGNHDWGVFHSLDEFNPLAREALLFTRKRLKPGWLGGRRRRLREFLAQLPPRVEDHGFLFVHGSPRDPIMEYVLKSDGFLEREKMVEIFAALDRPCFVGHTHWPGMHLRDFKFVQATDEHHVFELDGGPAVVNVGSVGQPRDGDPRASFAVVDGNRVEIHRVPYDFRRTQARILAAGLHQAIADRLARGK
jgi:diadenosine tetraphosphatase ApaH/serine/threonine PP2A family protein phosphatase